MNHDCWAAPQQLCIHLAALLRGLDTNCGKYSQSRGGVPILHLTSSRVFQIHG